MSRDDPSWIQERYPDILREGDDETVVRVVRDLDLAYQLGDLPLDSRAPRREDLRRRRFHMPAQRRVWRRRLSFTGAFVLAVFAVIGVAVAASGILNLGKPTNDVSLNDYFPLDGFHRISTALTLSNRPEVLFISAQNDAPSAVERWPLVKALEQFGTFAHVGTSAAQLPPFMGDALNAPTFDLTHAVYRSRYVAFVHKDVLDSQNRYYQKLNRVEEKLYTRYVRVNKGCGPDPNDPQHFLCTLYQALGSGTRRFPLVAVSNYLQTESQFLYPAAFQDHTSLHALPFATVQAALQQQQEPFDGSQIVAQVNGETNIITALICHADGAQPSKVCGRAAIKQILRHVR